MKFFFILFPIFLLNGCSGLANAIAEAERKQQEMYRQCATSGGVVYNGSCMSTAQAQLQQQADQQQRNRQANLQAACIQSGGTWAGYSCIGNTNPTPIIFVPRY